MAINHAVLDAVLNINHRLVQIHARTHLNVHSVLGATRQAIKVVQYTEIFNVAKNKLNSNFLSDNIRNKTQNVRDSLPPTNSHLNQPPNHSTTYAEATSDQYGEPPPTPNQELSNKITNFLEEFKSLVNPLISLLNKVITKLFDKI